MVLGYVDEIMKDLSPYYKKNPGPSIKYKLVIDTPGGTLEPLYFWLLNFMNITGGKTDKIIDNFASSPGSGHFSDLG